MKDKGAKKGKKRTKTENDAAFEVITDDLKAFFQEHGLSCAAMYRTKQHLFKRESPRNLILDPWPSYVVRVFVSFKDVVDRKAIDYILAIRAKDAKSLPMLRADELHFGYDKVDLEKVNPRFRFNTLEDLYASPLWS